MLRPTAPRLALAGALLHLALYGAGLPGAFTFDDRRIVRHRARRALASGR